MIPTSLRDIAVAVHGEISSSVSALEVTSVVTDNRAVVPGALFVAIAGENVNGNIYAKDALARGAVGILTQDPEIARETGADADRLLVVSDVVEALGLLARHNLNMIREHGVSDFVVVAVTGSVGKTTTKDLLSDVLAPRGALVAPPKSFNNEIGLPLTVLQADEHTHTLVLEMGADHVGNIEYLTSIAQPDVSVVLRVAPAHVGEFGGIDAVARAKAEIIAGTRVSGSIVLNADDARVRAMAESTSLPVTYFSVCGSETELSTEAYSLGSKVSTSSSLVANQDHRAAMLLARDVELDGEDKAHFTIVTPSGKAPVHLQLVGEHHVTNALAAASVAYVLGRSITETAEIMSESVPKSPHRMDVRLINGATVIDDSFNANPASMRAGIEALARIAGSRRTIAVVGEMLELGEATLEAHRDVAKYLEEHHISAVVSVGEAARTVSQYFDKHTDGAQQENPADHHTYALHCDSADEALDWLHSYLREDDVVLLKGSHGSKVWMIADALFTEGVTC